MELYQLKATPQSIVEAYQSTEFHSVHDARGNMIFAHAGLWVLTHGKGSLGGFWVLGDADFKKYYELVEEA